jgi:hypothetical protein
MRHALKQIVPLFLALVTAMGCKQDVGNVGWDVDILAPLIHTNLTLGDLVADSVFEADGNGALRLKIETSLIDLPLDSILKIPDTTVSKPIILPLALTNVQPGTEVFPITDVNKYELGEVALKKATLKTGKLKIKVKSILPTDVELRYLIPVASIYGNPFETVQTVPAGTVDDTSSVSFEFDLSGYNIDLRGFNGNSFNTLITTYIIKTSPTGQVVSIPANTPFFFIDYSFVDILPSYAIGYFGQQSSMADNDLTDLDVMKKFTEGQLFLDSVTIGLSVTNGVGADARFKLSQLRSINNRQSSIVDLNHQIIGNTLLLTRAQDPTGYAQDVIPSQLSYQLDNSNSNIKQFIENLPDQLGFTYEFELNPLGNVSAGNDFLYYDRPFEALMNIDIPLRTTMTNLTLVDTLEWNLSENATVEALHSGSFTLVAVNGFPMEAVVQLDLLDENQLVLHSLLVPSTVAAPALDSDLKVIAPLESRIIVPIPDEATIPLTQTRAIRIQVRFNTAAQPNLVELYASYSLDLKLIGNFNITLGTSSF